MQRFASGRCGRCSCSRPRARRTSTPAASTRRRRAGAPERARRLRAPRRGGEHLGRAERCDHRVDAGRHGAVLRSRGTTSRTGIRSSTRCRAAFAGFSDVGHDRRRSPPLFPYLLRLGDDRLVLGHRLSEWCGHGPILEEDIALANIALDLIGEATLLLKLAGEIEGGSQRRRARLFPRRHRLPQRAARRAAEGRLRLHDRAAVLLQRLLAAADGRAAEERERRAGRHRREGA